MKPQFDEVGPDGQQVREMFAGVAPRYDFLNRTLSLGIDSLWRRRTVRRVLADAAEGGVERRLRVLDLCTGTGDLALAFARAGCDVVAADFCPEMLVLGEAKRHSANGGDDVRFVGADAQHLPFDDDAFDAATVAFGIRNVHDPMRGLRELARVVRPGGGVYVLEFSKPKAPVVGPLYGLYFRHVLPRIGRMLSPKSRGADAYGYLPESVQRFPDREDFCELLRSAGLVDPRFELLSFGIASLYSARVEGDSAHA